MLTIKKSHILKLDLRGRFAINVVDNLIIVHHQASKVILLFLNYFLEKFQRIFYFLLKFSE